MSLLFRMFALWLQSLFKPRLPAEKPKNALTLRVLPNDIDINLHMNNGRYLTICDLTRVDIFIRTGLAKTMLKEKWMPVIAEHTMQYKKALKLFEKYRIEMEVTGWNEKAFQMLHTFSVNERVVIVSKSGVVAPVDVMDKVVSRPNGG